MPDIRQDLVLFLAQESSRFLRPAKSGIGRRPGLTGYDRRTDRGEDATVLMASEFADDMSDQLEFIREHRADS